MWADSGIGRLAFGDAASARGWRRERPVTTIKARGLSLPAPGVPRADYDQAERLGVATLKLIAAYAMRLVSGDRSVHKVVLFDEAWFLLASRDGRRLIDRLNRLGRAENATLILATQQLADVGEIENLIGTRLIFGQETVAEARRALELLGLDPDDRALVERRARLPQGPLPDARHHRPRRRGPDRPGPRAPARGARHLPRRAAATVRSWPHDDARLAGAWRRRRSAWCWRCWPAADAKYRGTDVLGNLSPESLLGGELARGPLPAVGVRARLPHRRRVTELNGVPPTIAHWAAAQLWSLTSFLVQDGDRRLHVGVLARPARRRPRPRRRRRDRPGRRRGLVACMRT